MPSVDGRRRQLTETFLDYAITRPSCFSRFPLHRREFLANVCSGVSNRTQTIVSVRLVACNNDDCDRCVRRCSPTATDQKCPDAITWFSCFSRFLFLTAAEFLANEYSGVSNRTQTIVSVRLSACDNLRSWSMRRRRQLIEMSCDAVTRRLWPSCLSRAFARRKHEFLANECKKHRVGRQTIIFSCLSVRVAAIDAPVNIHQRRLAICIRRQRIRR